MTNEITKTQREYLASARYEIIIERSLQSPESIRHIRARSAYRNLIAIHNGIISRNETIGKQFSILKEYLIKALNRFLKKKLSSSEKADLTQLIKEISGASYLHQIDIIIEKAIDITDQFKGKIKSSK